MVTPGCQTKTYEVLISLLFSSFPCRSAQDAVYYCIGYMLEVVCGAVHHKLLELQGSKQPHLHFLEYYGRDYHPGGDSNQGEGVTLKHGEESAWDKQRLKITD